MFHKIAVFADYYRAGDKSAPTESYYKAENERHNDNKNCCHGDKRVAEKVFKSRADFIKEIAEEFIHKSGKACRGQIAVIFACIFGSDAVGGGSAGADSSGYDSGKKSYEERHPIAEMAKTVFCFLFNSCACPHKKTPP